jgi:DNA-directed RNA polymerase specialized sigma24 family protein
MHFCTGAAGQPGYLTEGFCLRRIQTLLKLQEKSLKQAASVSGMSVGALKVATHWGIAALRTLLHDREPKE